MVRCTVLDFALMYMQVSYAVNDTSSTIALLVNGAIDDKEAMKVVNFNGNETCCSSASRLAQIDNRALILFHFLPVFHDESFGRWD